VRVRFVAGNWKMNTNRAQARALAEAIVAGAGAIPETVRLAIMPPFVYLEAVREVLGNGRVALGAQDVYSEPEGAYTGEVSAAMLVDVGCRYVIVGHSERRHILKEDDALVNRKLRAALAAGLDPILCIGETLDERERGLTLSVCERHVRSGLSGVGPDQMARVTIAYEPVWAIGTGRTATPEQAQEVHAEVRSILRTIYGQPIASAVCIQYGGSVKPENAGELMSQPDVDGALVGGASLKADSFLAIARAASRRSA